MASVHGGEEILPKGSTPCVGCTNVTDPPTDDRRQTELRQQRPERNVVTFGQMPPCHTAVLKRGALGECPSCPCLRPALYAAITPTSTMKTYEAYGKH